VRAEAVHLIDLNFGEKIMDNLRKWLKPRLMILARSNPEEIVLVTCKGDNTKGDHTTGHNYCISGRCDGARQS
jgi:hypothetical protein